MKRLLALFAAVTMTVSAMGITAMANENVSLVVNGEKIDFSDDQEPVIQNGRTLVPFRAVFEKIGAKVDWFEDIKRCQAEYGGITAGITIGDTTVSLGEAAQIESDVPAQIINGRTMVPLRILSESIGAGVDWNGTTRTITVNIFPLESEAPESEAYTLTQYETVRKASDGYNYIYASVAYPQLTTDGNFVPSLNTQLESSAKKAAESFVESYSDAALKIYENPPEHLFEVPYSLSANCQVEITVGNIAIITTDFFESKYGEDLNTYTDTIKINLANGKVVE